MESHTSRTLWHPPSSDIPLYSPSDFPKNPLCPPCWREHFRSIFFQNNKVKRNDFFLFPSILKAFLKGHFKHFQRAEYTARESSGSHHPAVLKSHLISPQAELPQHLQGPWSHPLDYFEANPRDRIISSVNTSVLISVKTRTFKNMPLQSHCHSWK